MALPDPHPGLVVGYAYLWADQALAGREEGVKDRPCAIVVARRAAEGRVAVTVVPITHSPPSDLHAAVELPPALKAHLGLDAGRSWIVLSETNEFLWPGPDLRPAAGRDDVVYGVLPPGFFRRVRERLLALVEERSLRRVGRTE